MRTEIRHATHRMQDAINEEDEEIEEQASSNQTVNSDIGSDYDHNQDFQDKFYELLNVVSFDEDGKADLDRVVKRAKDTGVAKSQSRGVSRKVLGRNFIMQPNFL